MPRRNMIDKVVALVVSEKYYILNFYECAFQVFYPGECTIIYCNPFELLTVDVVQKIKDAPTRLVALIPHPELDLQDIVEGHRMDGVRNQAMLQRIFNFCLYMSNFDEDISGKKNTYEERIKETTENFQRLNEVLKIKCP